MQRIRGSFDSFGSRIWILNFRSYGSRDTFKRSKRIWILFFSRILSTPASRNFYWLDNWHVQYPSRTSIKSGVSLFPIGTHEPKIKLTLLVVLDFFFKKSQKKSWFAFIIYFQTILFYDILLHVGLATTALGFLASWSERAQVQTLSFLDQIL